MSQTELALEQARQALQAQDWQAARLAFDRVLAFEPRQLEALSGLATVALALQQFEQAVLQAQRAVGLFPQAASAHYILGLALFSAGQLEPALTHLRQTTALEPEHALAWIRLGQIYTRHGLPFYGFSCLERAQQLWPEQAVDTLSLSQAAWRAGLWEPFQRWTESFYVQIPDLSQRLWVYSRWLDLLGYQSHCSDADWVALLAQWETHLPSRLSLLPAQPQRLASAPSAALRVACLSHSAEVSQTLLAPLVALLPIELQIFSPVSGADQALWQSDGEASPQALLPALQAWQPALIVDQVGFSRPEVLSLPRQLPQSVWLSGTDPDYPSPVLSGVIQQKWPVCFAAHTSKASSTTDPLAYPAGAPVVGYMGPVRALSAETLQLWGDLLLARPQLRLCVFSPEIDDPLLKQYLEQIFQSRGISGYRLRLLGNCASQEPLSFFFGQVQLVLAPFPRSSWLQTCQALWWGRPVLGLADPRWQERNQAVNVLSTLGWEPGLAQNSEDWLNKAQALLEQPPEPLHLRALLAAAEAPQAVILAELWRTSLQALGVHNVARS